MEEAKSRGAKIILISDAEGVREHGQGTMASLVMPSVPDIALPLLYAVPVQLLAYHTAVCKGNDVDQPRNLAKSVTVE
jgi:glucosamine--fructose-6-phosphate aminotransferase (isomerizing)